MKENEFGRQFSAALRRRGAEVYPLIAGVGTPDGWPDILVVHRQWTGLVERKATNTQIKPIQVVRMRDINLRRHEHDRFCVIARLAGSQTIKVGWINGRTGHYEDMFSCLFEAFLDSMQRYEAAARRGELDLSIS